MTQLSSEATIFAHSIIAVVVVSLVSLIGVITLLVGEKKIEKALLVLVSFAAGGLLGDTFIHLLPEIAANQGLDLRAGLVLLAGMLGFFVLEKFIAWRHCHIPTSKTHPHPVVFMNLIGDGFHNFIDGMVIAASFLVSEQLGVATTLAVLFHEIPQEIGDFGVLIYGGLSRKKALIFNFSSALMAVLGALIVLTLGSKFEVFQDLLPFTAGGFIYIASTDLIPELHKETGIKKSVVQFLGLLLGVGIMVALRLFG